MSVSLLLPYIQIGLSVLLIAGILLQRSEAGLGSTFGADSLTAQYTRRGFEKVIFRATLVIAFLFALSAIIALIT